MMNAEEMAYLQRRDKGIIKWETSIQKPGSQVSVLNKIIKHNILNVNGLANKDEKTFVQIDFL